MLLMEGIFIFRIGPGGAIATRLTGQASNVVAKGAPARMALFLVVLSPAVIGFWIFAQSQRPKGTFKAKGSDGTIGSSGGGQKLCMRLHMQRWRLPDLG